MADAEPVVNGVATEEPVVNGVATEEPVVNGVEPEDQEKERKLSSGSDNIQLSTIQVIIKHQSESEDESEEDSDEEEEKPKKKVVKKKKKKSNKVNPAEVLTKTLAQAIRLINEQKEKERQKARKEEIRRLALEQKQRMDNAGAQRVILHV